MTTNKIEHNLYENVCFFENLYKAFLKARRYKKYNQQTLQFEYNLEKELFSLKGNLEDFSYHPRPQKEFTVYKDYCRKTCFSSAFSDSVVQQALLNVIEPIFEKSFIFDSYAFRRGKGTHSALKRFDEFKRKVSPRRFPNSGFIFKADIRDYYPSIKHSILFSLLRKKIQDERIIRLIEKFIELKHEDKGIPIGSPLSQLFANIYLNELDYFVKQSLKKKFYLRYADDFVVLNKKLKPLQETKQKIEVFLRQSLHLELSPDKTRIVTTDKGVDLLGYRIFYHYKLLRRKNVRIFKKRLLSYRESLQRRGLSTRNVTDKIRGWVEYARYANSYKLRKNLLFKSFVTGQ